MQSKTIHSRQRARTAITQVSRCAYYKVSVGRGRHVCRAGANGSDALVDADKTREIARMLLATQKNMLAINNSRVKVQEELAVANRRIADLERELERLKAEGRQTQQVIREAQLPPPFSSDRGLAVAAPQRAQEAMQQQQQQPPQQRQQQPPQQQQQRPPTPTSQPVVQQQPPSPPQQQQQQQQQQRPAPPPQQPPQPAPPAVISITYVTGWHNAYIHYNVDNKGWTNVPGVRMSHVQGDHNSKTVTFEGSTVEFVMNNGDNDWDSPGRFSDKPKNYEVLSPGSYRLKSGKLEKVS